MLALDPTRTQRSSASTTTRSPSTTRRPWPRTPARRRSTCSPTTPTPTAARRRSPRQRPPAPTARSRSPTRGADAHLHADRRLLRRRHLHLHAQRRLDRHGLGHGHLRRRQPGRGRRLEDRERGRRGDHDRRARQRHRRRRRPEDDRLEDQRRPTAPSRSPTRGADLTYTPDADYCGAGHLHLHAQRRLDRDGLGRRSPASMTRSPPGPTDPAPDGGGSGTGGDAQLPQATPWGRHPHRYRPRGSDQGADRQ